MAEVDMSSRRSRSVRAYRGGTALLAAVTVALGLVLIGRGIAGGAPVAVLLGALFVAAGAGRIYLLRRR